MIIYGFRKKQTNKKKIGITIFLNIFEWFCFSLVSVVKPARLLKTWTGNLDGGDWFRAFQRIFQSQKGCELKKKDMSM